MSAPNLETTCLQLRPDMTAQPLPVDASFWPSLMAGRFGNFHLEHLVTCSTCDKQWASWDANPQPSARMLFITAGEGTVNRPAG